MRRLLHLRRVSFSCTLFLLLFLFLFSFQGTTCFIRRIFNLFGHFDLDDGLNQTTRILGVVVIFNLLYLRLHQEWGAFRLFVGLADFVTLALRWITGVYLIFTIFILFLGPSRTYQSGDDLFLNRTVINDYLLVFALHRFVSFVDLSLVVDDLICVRIWVDIIDAHFHSFFANHYVK